MTRRPPTAAQLQAQCDAWNAECPVGTAVRVRPDYGETFDTVTTSDAQVLSGHSAVIWLKGIRGFYDLNRVTKIAQEGKQVTEEATAPAAAPVRERKGRNTYIVNVGAEMREMEVEADDYEVTREGVWFSREDNTEAGSHVVVFASHPCLVRDAADEA